LRVNQSEVQEGKDRLRWLEDVEKDLWEMKFKRWQEKAVDTEEWVSVIRGGQGSQRAIEPRSKFSK
jgi:hypothetical protein